MQPIEIRADGVWLSQAGDVADVSYSFTWGVSGIPGGCELLSFTFDYPAEHVPPMLRRGVITEAHDGSGIPVWAGLMSEPERDGNVWRCHAKGYGYEAARWPAMADVLGTDTPTTDADDAVEWAIGQGLPWTTLPGGLFDPVLAPAETTSVNDLESLLNYAATSMGARWAVWADAVLAVGEDPTMPTWVASPDVLAPGVADENYVSRLYGRYITTLSGTPPVPSAWDTTPPVVDEDAEDRWGVSAKVIDYTKLGVVMDPVDLALDMSKRLKLAGARLAYTNALTLTRADLTTLGGVPAAPSQVRAGQMLRINRFLDVAGNLALGVTTDVVIQRTVYNHADDAVTIEPLGMVPRDFEGILANPEPPPETQGVEIDG